MENAEEIAQNYASQESIEALKHELLEAINKTESDWSWLLCFLLFGLIAGAIIGLRKFIVDWIVAQAKKSDNKVDDVAVDLVNKWTQPYVAISFGAFIATEIYPLSVAIDTFCKAVFLGIVVWRIVRSLESSLSFLVSHYIFEGSKSADNMSANFRKALQIFLYGAGAIFVMDNLGFNISSLVAGLGIGGLAVALAAQAVLGDAIAGISLFIDRPFSVGDAITVNGATGTIEKVGFKTTKLRSVGGELIVFPNSSVSSATIQNFTRSEGGSLNQATTVAVSNKTSVEVVKEIPNLIMEALTDQQGFHPAEVYFKEFGKFSFNFEIRYVVANASPVTCRAALGKVNTLVLDLFVKHNIAGPTPKTIVHHENQQHQ